MDKHLILFFVKIIALSSTILYRIVLCLFLLPISAIGQSASNLQILDTRYLPTSPSSYSQKFEVNFKQYHYVGLPSVGSSWNTILGFRGWSDDSGGKAHELAFSDDNQIRIRSGLSSGWESWRRIISEDNSGNVGIGTIAPDMRLGVVGSELGGTLNDLSKLVSLSTKIGVNQSSLQIFSRRFANGTSWATASTRIQQKIDATDMAFIEFNPQGMSWGMTLGTADQGRLWIDNAGNVGIGTNKISDPGFRLFVDKGIRTRKITVDSKNWPDYVFDTAYDLPTFAELRFFTKKHGHLPDVPSAAQIAREGLDVAGTQEMLLRKIEELTLYIMQLNERLEKVEAKQRQAQAGKFVR